ncbi:MAG: hypothetical protein J2O47_10155, partial [Acidimicrobiaceae bacterium]|nr:hypothetical protein [Acidimicrobiaceae bacterium]
AWLRPYDEKAILDAAASTGKILVVEEHSIVGGVTALVAEVIGRNGVTARLADQAIPAGEIEVGVPAELLRHYGFTAENVASKVRNLAKA